MAARKLSGPWTFPQGLLVLVIFLVIYASLSATHMYWVKNTIGFDAYLGDGPRLPPKLLITSQLIKAATLIGVVWLIALKARNLSWDAIGLRRCHWGWLVAAVGVAVVGAAVSLLLAKALIFAAPDWGRFAASRYAWNDAPPWQMLFLIGITIVLTPIAEEIFFRGFLFQWMATHRPIWVAMLVSSAMFGASHIIPSQMIVAAFMSLLIISLFLASRSIWPCMVCHGVNNALGVFLGMAATENLLPLWLTPPMG